jgi:glycosyltransferase involved in cell wall biosynthesis
LRELFFDTHPDVVHFHHSLLIGIETLRIARECCPKATIAYTLHEYLPICRNNGHLIKTKTNLICYTAEPHQCVQCFSDQDVDRYVLRRRLFQTYFRDVDVFIAPSAYLKDRFVHWGLPAERITVIPNGHRSIGRQEPNQKPSQHANRFGFFGQYVDAKGIDVLIAAAARAAAQTDHDVIVKVFGGNKQYATPEYTAKIDRLLADAPKNLKVEEHGSYQREAVVELMEQVDWVVVPSIWPETFALVVSEAWEAKRPVIGSNAGGLGERLRNLDHGFLFQPGNVEQLSEIMLDCVGNPELWTEHSIKIRGEISIADAWGRHKALFDTHRRAA